MLRVALEKVTVSSGWVDYSSALNFLFEEIRVINNRLVWIRIVFY